MDKKTHEQIVYKICKEHCPARTEQLEIIGLRTGISGGSVGRYLRWLAEQGKIEGKRENGDKTKTWTLKDPEQKETEKESSPFKQFIPKPLTMEFMRDNRQELDRILV